MSLLDDAADWLPRLRSACRQQSTPFVAPPLRGSQPIQTLYWGAHRVSTATLEELADQARSLFRTHAPDPETLGAALGFPEDPLLCRTVHERVDHKLVVEPIEDLRVDFEDGYGIRPDAEEDETAARVARILGEADRSKTAPRRFGIRIKPLTPELAARSLRTLEAFVSTLTQVCEGPAEAEMVVTLPKVTVTEQVQAIDELLTRLEVRVGLPHRSIGLEIMIEVPGAVFDGQGRLLLPRLLAAASPRLLGVHLGVYDFTAAHDIAAMHQAMDHPACDLVRGLMGLAFSGSGRTLSAGSTNVLPVPADRREAVHRAWRLAHDQIRHTLIRGYYHGWDLHPGQLPVRYATCYRFYLEGLQAASQRMKNVVAASTAATDQAAVLDDVATGQALLGWFQRGVACGALDEAALQASGLRTHELVGSSAVSSFAELLGRRVAAP